VVREIDQIMQTEAPADRVRASILIVDDRKANRVALQAILEPLGEQIVSADSGRQALREVLQTEFAVILMDVQMPDMDGLETAALIRQREASRYIPIIFITAVSADEEEMFQGYSVGAVDYITKPFSQSTLLSKVTVFVELYRKEQLLRKQTRQLHKQELEALQMKQKAREQKLEQEKIRQVNRMLEERVQERTAELEAFCYSISHDLRTPLRAIDGYSAILEQELAGDGLTAVQDSLQRIRQSAQKMDELISALLALSRIARAETRLSTVNLSDLAASVGEEMELGGTDWNGEFRIQPDMTADADPTLLRCVYSNLLSNARKFTSETISPLIEVGSSKEDDGRTVFFVKDNGAGFNESYAHKLFQPFERLHRVDQYPGHGIGLATVLRIVRKHGGSVWAKGEEGKGAQFFFTL